MMDVLQPKQLKLLMTAAEIQEEYQPLDADRAWRNRPINRGGERTQRRYRSDGGYNDMTAGPGYRRRKSDFAPESDEEVWARKRKEADANGLTESVRKYGVVYPIPLGDTPGLAGKPQITGGHHRIAAAMDSPQFLPVMHHQGLIEGAVTAFKRMGQQYR